MPGGTFFRNNDGVIATSENWPATISDFRLDKYEVTVGRFRQFVAAYARNMTPAGAGKNPNNPSDLGWDPAWETGTDIPPFNYPFMPTDQAALKASLQCSLTSGENTWTDAAGANEDMPINCVDWYVAFAFCIWDGGRLPSETEWEYAAMGGSEQRFYPWSQPPTSELLDDSYAVYCGGSCKHPEDVGSRSPKGDGKWGHADLAGNVREPTMDDGNFPMPCVDCATTPQSYAVMCGGEFSTNNVRSTYVLYSSMALSSTAKGIRCARAK